jgi:hypothetical protein
VSIGRGAVITQEFYDARSATNRFVPVLFDAADESQGPRARPRSNPLLPDGRGGLPGPVRRPPGSGRCRAWSCRRAPSAGRAPSAAPLSFTPEPGHQAPKIDLSHLPAAKHFLARQPELGGAAGSRPKRRVCWFLAVPVLATGTTAALVGAAVDATPLPDVALADAVSQQVAKDLARIRERYLSGARAAAIAELDELLALPVWKHLAAILRGRLLRTAALYRLDFGKDDAGAEALAARAAAEDPSGDGQALAAHLALRRGDTKAALALLEVPRSLQARHLKAAMLIEGGDGEAALGILATPPEPTEASASDAAPQADPTDASGNTAETWRLRALAHLVLKQLPEAVEAVDAARALAPDWIAVRSAAAVVDFWRVSTPAALTLTDQPLWPMPFARTLVRADASAHLAQIDQTFATVADTLPAGSDEQGHWLTWRLIALLAVSDRRDAATELAKRLIGDDGPLPIWPLLWARFFGLDLDRARLKERLKSVPAEDPNFILLTGLYLELRLEDGEVEKKPSWPIWKKSRQ